MWTTEQRKLVENTLAREILTPNAFDYALLVKDCKVDTKMFGHVEIRVKLTDMKDDVSMIQLSNYIFTNILNECRVENFMLGGVTTSIFSDEVHFDVYIHFRENTLDQ